MIIFNLEFLNTLLALIGIAGWSWVWWFSKYKTGHDMRTQIGVIVFGVVWVVLFLADTAQDFKPTSLTVIARSLILMGMWCCMPLLKKQTESLEPNAPEIKIKKIRIRGKSL